MTRKVIAITGASRVIGQATAVYLAAQGARVVLGGRDEDRLSVLAGHITSVGGYAAYAKTDVTRRADLIALVALGSGLVDHSQKMTVAARATAEKKTVGHRS